MDDLDALEFFRSEIRLTNDNVVPKRTMTRMAIIAWKIGWEKTQNELITFCDQISQDINDSDPSKGDPLGKCDETMYKMAQNLSMICCRPDCPAAVVHKVCGSILARLATADEICVRNRAVKSFAEILDVHAQVKDPDTGTLLIDLVQTKTMELAAGDFFTYRVSACGLYKHCYKHQSAKGAVDGSKMSAEQQEILSHFASVFRDESETPMVRRAAAKNFKGFIEECRKDVLLDESTGILDIWVNQLCKDDQQDILRVNAVECCLYLAQVFDEAERAAHLKDRLVDLVADKSWKVRLDIASKFDKFLTAFRRNETGAEKVSDVILHKFIHLLKDAEADVRSECLFAIQRCIAPKDENGEPIAGATSLIDTDKMISLIVQPYFTNQMLLADTSQHVRASVAKIIGDVARQVGADHTNQQLMNPINALLSDDAAEVKLNMVLAMSGLVNVMGNRLLTNETTMPLLHDRILDNQWRIREAVVQQIPDLIECYGDENTAKAKEVKKEMMNSLGDSVFKVKYMAVKQIGRYCRMAGEAATKEMLQSLVNEVANNPGETSYSSRLIHVRAMGPDGIASALTHSHPLLIGDGSEEGVLKRLLATIDDPVPNVRLAALDCIFDMAYAKSEDGVGMLNKSSIGLILGELKSGGSKANVKDDVDVENKRAILKELLEAMQAGAGDVPSPPPKGAHIVDDYYVLPRN